jgi:hypothetical protein
VRVVNENDLPDLRAVVADLARRLSELEDVTAIRRLHHVYGYLMDYCRFDSVIDLFCEDGEAVFLSGVYKGRSSLRRLYKDFLQHAYTRGRSGPLYGFLADHVLAQDVITVAADRATARGRFRALLMLGSHESRPDAPPELPEQVYEAGLYENEYVREDGVWKIRRLEYALQWQALYEKGWAHTTTNLPPALKPFPEDPLGPDYLLETRREVWPARSAVAFHYVHPVTGRAL